MFKLTASYWNKVINIGTSFSKVDQYNSKAKSNYAPNTGESNGMFYRVTGSQDIQGN